MSGEMLRAMQSQERGGETITAQMQRDEMSREIDPGDQQDVMRHHLRIILHH